MLRPPLGSVRLTIIELVAVLLRTGSEEAESAIIESSAVQEVLQVFLRFPFNSILHHQVGPYPFLKPPLHACCSRCHRGSASFYHSIAGVKLLGSLVCPSRCQERQASGFISCRQLCSCERVSAQQLYTR